MGPIRGCRSEMADPRRLHLGGQYDGADPRVPIRVGRLRRANLRWPIRVGRSEIGLIQGGRSEVAILRRPI